MLRQVSVSDDWDRIIASNFQMEMIEMPLRGVTLLLNS